MDLISIIIPVYKVEAYLKNCIESVIGQTYKNLEIILVDDGSPDNCSKICDEYASIDNRIKVIHKENGGLSSARNAGLDIATGDYLSFIDSDDFVSKEFIEKLHSLCVNNDTEISICDYMQFQDEVELKDVEVKIDTYSPHGIQKNMYSNDYAKMVVVWNKLYKKSLYENLRFPIGKINEDEFTTYKVFYNTKKNVVVTNEPLYFYRYNENSIMGKKYNIKRLDVLDAYEERKKFYKQLDEKELFERTVIKYQEFIMDHFLWTKEYIEDSEKIAKEIFKKAKENYEDYKKIENKPIKKKIKINFFMIMPNVYSFFIKIKRLIK